MTFIIIPDINLGTNESSYSIENNSEDIRLMIFPELVFIIDYVLNRQTLS